ncbi:MAG: IS110 family transposase [Holosporaceae bacterium]|jgi:transposase|nr:IS110 family transposase [Holosporaceae bacterium]
MRHIGVDLHSDSFTVCYSEKEKREKIRTFKLQGKEFEAFLSDLRPSDEIALEATGNSSFFRDAVLSLVKRAIIVAPHKFNVIRNSTNKTDKNDARAIALFLSKDMLPEARAKSPLHRQLLEIARTREQLVKTRIALINKVYGILNGHGLKIKKEQLTTLKGFEKAVAFDKLGHLEQTTIRIIKTELISLKLNANELEKLLIGRAKDLPGYANLTSVKGIGAISAAIFLAHIGDVRDFEDAGKLASYFGITPKVRRSNGKRLSDGRITKRGSKLARRTLVQCALIAKRYNARLDDFYRKIKERRGSGKAIVATARKLLNAIYYTLKNDWMFEDFSNFKLVSHKS